MGRIRGDLISGFWVLLLLVAMFGVVLNVPVVKGGNGTIYIRADGSIDPLTAPISTLDNVTYIFTDDINDSIVIERSNIIIDGNGTTHQGPGFGSGFDLGVNNVTIKSTNIKNFSSGIFVHSSYLDVISDNNITASGYCDIFLDAPSGYNSISGNNIANSYEGIHLDSSLGNSITENNITGNHIGILLDFSTDNGINGNDITNNDAGIVLYYSSSNNVSGNTFVNDGLQVEYSGNVVTGNLVNGKPLVYLEEVSDYVVKDAGQVILVKCNNVTVESLNLSNTDVGVQLFETNNARISGNSIIANNIQGIRLGYSSNNSISGNNITDNYEGLFLGSSSYNNISGNNVMNNSRIGIFLYSSSKNIISGNDVKKNVYGIWLYSSLGNKCHHNNFIDNTYHAYSSGEQNVWDDGYPSCGNYWSCNYTAVDIKSGEFQNETSSDGVCDTAYVIDASNIDNYPLMGMFSDFGTTSEHHVQTICNSSISDFQYNGTAIIFNVTGENGTLGFCRICIPTALMNGTYRVFVNGTEVSCNLLSCSNSTHMYLYFNYTHSAQEVIIIPEFPSFLVLPLFMIATLLAVIVYKRKKEKLISTFAF